MKKNWEPKVGDFVKVIDPFHCAYGGSESGIGVIIGLDPTLDRIFLVKEDEYNIFWRCKKCTNVTVV